MTTHVPNLCDACARAVDLTGESTPDGQAVCRSFPFGIPEDIIVWGGDHRQPVAAEAPFELDPERREEFDQWLATFHPEEETAE
jgi:hypothetical protein